MRRLSLKQLHKRNMSGWGETWVDHDWVRWLIIWIQWYNWQELHTTDQNCSLTHIFHGFKFQIFIPFPSWPVANASRGPVYFTSSSTTNVPTPSSGMHWHLGISDKFIITWCSLLGYLYGYIKTVTCTTRTYWCSLYGYMMLQHIADIAAIMEPHTNE